MVHPDQVRSAITQALPDATVDVEDLTGGGDHLQVKVVSTAFDLSLIHISEPTRPY